MTDTSPRSKSSFSAYVAEVEHNATRRELVQLAAAREHFAAEARRVLGDDDAGGDAGLPVSPRPPSHGPGGAHDSVVGSDFVDRDVLIVSTQPPQR